MTHLEGRYGCANPHWAEQFHKLRAAPAEQGERADHLADLTQGWLAFLEASRRAAPATVRCYQIDVGQFVEFLAAAGHSLSVAEVTPQDVAAFRDSNPGWRPSTTKRKLAALSRFFDWAVEHGLAPTNPARSVAGPADRGPTTSFVTADDFIAMLLKCGSDRERAILATLFYAGPRHGELRQLELADMSLSRDEILVTGKGGFRAPAPSSRL